ncbi:LuxR C-terminal-related transcriptional regulator [Nocardioides kongjuensis]|uniref:DNA-binding CsgD family transcriptional regulator n=1 Tax=Nocardioides kongjuensis TaxID=349522 RepID=A0A852RSE6_9ACTN|nr:DNA-binding CsgD family transcriptional regulator [Nocardioides kongjuensis]
MTPGPHLVPTRRRALDDLAGTAARLVLVTAPAGGGLSTFLRAYAEAADATHRLLGLSWEDAPGSALAGADPGGGDLVVLEDAHHADPSSVQALVSAARAADGPRVVLGWRVPGGADPAQDLLFDSVRAAADEVVPLAALSAEDVAALAEQRGVVLPASQVDRLLRHTGGRVRHVVELLDDVPASDWTAPWFALPAPATAARAVRAALGELDDTARSLVQAVAVLEAADRHARAVPVEDAGAVADLDATTAAIGHAVRSGLLVSLDEHDAWARLRDPVVRREVLDDLGPVRRSELHHRAAEVVADPAVALRHRWFAHPRPDDALADQLDALAAQRAGQGAWSAAADLLVLASQASADREARADRLVRGVDALVGAGEVPRASRYLPELESLRETPLRNAVLGYLAVVRGRPAEAESRLGRAWELVNPRREAGTASLVAQRYVLHHLARCRPRDLVTWADRAMELVDPAAPTAVEAAAVRGLGVAPTEGIDVALDGYRALMERVPEGPVAQRVTMASGWLHLAADDPDRAREELESAVPTDFLGGSLRISLWARGWLARVQFQAGDWDEAMRTASAGLELAQRSGMSLLVPLLAWTRTQVLALRGDWEAAEQSLRTGDAVSRDYELMRVPAALARAAYSEARADYPAVVRALAPLTQPWARDWVEQPGYWPWADVHANALVLVGRQDEADAFLARHEQVAREHGHMSATARLAYARGRWYGVRGDLDAARACFQEAIALLEPLPLRYDRARVHFAFGQTLRRAGRRAEADAVITAARDAYLALGAATYVARCDRELAAGGVNVVRGHREFDDLTPQEEAVAGLVAQGRSNKEVAAELFLSVKTVQFHLTRVYAKLGVRSRAELAARRSR